MADQDGSAGAFEVLSSYVRGGLSENDGAMDALDRAEAEVSGLRDRVAKQGARIDELEARIARYEAPSPSLMSVADATRIGLNRAVEKDADTARFLAAADAAMEQHARCMSVHGSVARLLWPLAKRSVDIAGYSGASGDWPLQDAVSALTKAMLNPGRLSILSRLIGVDEKEIDRLLDLDFHRRSDVGSGK